MAGKASINSKIRNDGRLTAEKDTMITTMPRCSDWKRKTDFRIVLQATSYTYY